MERYPHCDWLKTSYSANKVTFCKYAPRSPPHWLRVWWQSYSDCRLQTSAGIRDWTKFMCTVIR